VQQYLRWLLLFVGGVCALFTVGFFFQMPWATAAWPWPDSRLSYVFLASIMAAIAAPNVWIGLSRAFRAIVGGAINLAIMYGGMAVAFFVWARSDGAAWLLAYAAGSAIAALLIGGLALLARRYPPRDSRPMPALVRVSFGIFAVALVPVSSQLLLAAPTIFPWPLRPESSVIFGCIFLGAAAYFVYGVARPSWENACGQLLGFLAYDLILIGLYLAHFATVRPEHRLSLVIYVAVLLYSGTLAVYYLFVHPATRLWPPSSTRVAPPVAAAPAP
jgi:hypothetical protein